MEKILSNNNNIKILDCTLRDGGSINNWNFGYGNIIKILQNLNDAGIDIIENGFIQNNYTDNDDCSISDSIFSFDKKLKHIKNKHFKAVAMINLGKYDVEKLPEKKETLIDGIRLMFKKNEIEQAVNYSQIIKDKGYSISLNPVSVTTYSEEEISYLCSQANSLMPSIVYIIDTYGLLDNQSTLDYFKKFNSLLKKDIEIGYHAHNNLQLAFSNTLEIIKAAKERTVVVDGSLYGMGKRAGNVPVELLTNYLDTNYNKEYNTDKITEVIENIIMPLHKQYEWGYSIIHYTAAINKCHSDYVTYLSRDKKLSIKEINHLLKEIIPEYKLTFNKEYIDKLYDQSRIEL